METAILKFFENIRNPFLDYFFGFFTLFGEEFVVAGIILAIYLLWNKSYGERILLTLLTATTITTGLKGIGRARPFHAGVVSAGNIPVADLGLTSSFPSGHATCISALSIGATVSLRKKKVIVSVASVASLFIVLVSLSRLYFGVHYPSDVLVGIAIGAASSFFWAFVYKKLYSKRLYIFLFFALVTLPLLFIPALQKDDNIFKMSALMLSVAGFLFFERYAVPLQDCKKWLHRLYRVLILLALVIVLYLPLHFLPKSNIASFFKILILTTGTLFSATALFKLFKI